MGKLSRIDHKRLHKLGSKGQKKAARVKLHNSMIDACPPLLTLEASTYSRYVSMAVRATKKSTFVHTYASLSIKHPPCPFIIAYVRYIYILVRRRPPPCSDGRKHTSIYQQKGTKRASPSPRMEERRPRAMRWPILVPLLSSFHPSAHSL